MLEVHNLSKSFFSPSGKTIPVLRDISFSVKAGELVAVMGASGAGKSTLLHLLGGLETPDEGEIKFPRSVISFVFQFHYLLSDLSALENVSLPLRISRMSVDQAHQHGLQILASVGLAERTTHKVGDLSGGEQQRVAVARALITEPALVLADEPTGNLDSSIASEIGTLFANYARQKQAMVIIATHNEHLAAICDRVLVLRDGHVLES
jgi:lipoprotein-releasing system ATP-binding protein